MNASVQSIIEKTGVPEPVAIRAFALMNEDLMTATLLCTMYTNTDGVTIASRRIGKRRLIKGFIELCKEFNNGDVPCRIYC